MRALQTDRAIEDTGYSAYQDGRTARRQGNPIEVNPFVRGTHESNEFIRGWGVENTAQRLLRAH